jgi:nitroreductase
MTKICEKEKWYGFSGTCKKSGSVRDYDPDKPVDEAILTKILETGRYALSAVNKQPWNFILVSNQDMLAKIKLSYNREWLQSVSHMLLVTGNKKEVWYRKDGYCSIETDLVIAVDYLILAATAEPRGQYMLDTSI